MSDEAQTDAEEQAPDPAEPAFIAGRSRKNAQRALDAADAVEIDQVQVRAVRDGYFAPYAVVEEYERMLEAEREAQAELDAAAEAEAIESDGTGGEPVTVETAEANADTPPAQVENADGSEVTTDENGVPVGEAKVIPLAEDEAAPEDNAEWTHPKIDAFAEQHNIELASGLNKTDKVAAILAALNTEE